MAERGRGKKENNSKNYGAHKAWMEAKKVGRVKQIWIRDSFITSTGHWEKVIGVPVSQ